MKLSCSNPIYVRKNERIRQYKWIKREEKKKLIWNRKFQYLTFELYHWEYCPSIGPKLCFRLLQLSYTPEECSIRRRIHTIRLPWRNCRNKQLQTLEDAQRTRCSKDLWKENHIRLILYLRFFLQLLLR